MERLLKEKGGHLTMRERSKVPGRGVIQRV